MRSLRREKNMTRKEIAHAIGCTETSVYWFEMGKCDMTWYHLSKYAKLMGITTVEQLNEVMEDDGRKKARA